MKLKVFLFSGLILWNLLLTAGWLQERRKPERQPAPTSASKDRAPSLEPALAQLRADVRDLQEQLRQAAPPPNEAEGQEDIADSDSLTHRLRGIESSLASLQRAMDGVSIETASAERDALFRGENGHLKADEYFEAGKFAIAGEGYLKFLESHPDHPDHRNVLQRARAAFRKAGYMDKALWAQEELMRIYPEHRGEDLMTLARMEQQAGRYSDAARHAAESAELVTDSSRYWNLMYSAWYTQLAEGNAAGLAAYRDVERQIEAAGYGQDRLGERAREKIEELERQIADAQR